MKAHPRLRIIQLERANTRLQAPWDEVVASIRRMVRVTSLPLSADIEGGYGDSPEAVAASVRAVIDAGVAGINLEDGIRHQSLRTVDDAARRIAAARQPARDAGVPIVINARVDSWMIDDEASTSERVKDAIRRADAYLAAGADCIFPIGVVDSDVIATLCATIKAPINIGARAGLPSLAELGRLGVARVSTATRLATVAFASASAAAERLQRTGNFDGLNTSLDYESIQHLFASLDVTVGRHASGCAATNRDRVSGSITLKDPGWPAAWRPGRTRHHARRFPPHPLRC